ncbi:DNA-binding MarR family transcriptional regulator [Croceifilum oryzae]|uniref:DNA-binding MarR family transcriptional regulator n=1 Tax=Croceifilum oryzae TaxID=1553429 RepID=A0AAJ1WSM4_9BACL|nr:MarR family transcriptional regulator [Croceifilum oryzae]MDQ0416111.1 DNA-binding MarR family transcriptional regulator [Croceifilum oryzae]
MPDSVKPFIHGTYMRFLHLNEQRMDADLHAFLKEATDDDLTHFPKNMTAVHVIDCIGRNEPINNTAIAKQMNLSKANITKISTKLLQGEFIRRFQLTDNKKEIYFRLTPKGKRVCDLHEKLHVEKEQRFYQFLDSFSDTEQEMILKFLRELTGHITEEQKEGREDS